MLPRPFLLHALAVPLAKHPPEASQSLASPLVSGQFCDSPMCHSPEFHFTCDIRVCSCWLKARTPTVHYVGLDKGDHTDSIIQSIATSLKILWRFILPSSLTHSNHRRFYQLRNFAFSRMSCKWTNTIPSLFRYNTKGTIPERKNNAIKKREPKTL